MANNFTTLQRIRPLVALASGLILSYLVFGGFVFRLLMLYTLPMLYLYLRLKSRIISLKWRRWFGLLFVLLVLAFPLAETLSHTRGVPALTPLITVGYLTMPFLFYLFLLSALFDLLLGLNHLLKLNPPERTKKRTFRMASLGILALLSVGIVILGIWNHSIIRVNEFRIDIPARASVLSRLRIVLVADFHLGSHTRKGFLNECINRINSLDPDLVLIPGDILEGDRDDLDMRNYESQFRKLRPTVGVFASPGNHEFHHNGGQSGFFERAGIIMLRDSWIKIDEAICLIGRNDPHASTRKSLEELLNGIPESLPVILMNHRPQEFESASRTRVDIQVSGHSHHGQLFPLNLVTGLVHDLSWGHKKIKNTHFFVTCGIQLWGPPVRTAGVSELMLINITLRHQPDITIPG